MCDVKKSYDISQVSSAVSRERNWPTCDFNHITNRNRLACATGGDVIKVHCSLRLLDKIEEIGHYATNMEWSLDEDSD